MLLPSPDPARLTMLPCLQLLTPPLLLLGLLVSVQGFLGADERSAPPSDPVGSISLDEVQAPSTALREAFKLSPHYAKSMEVQGFPIVGSKKVNDYALLEAAHWIGKMLQDRDDVREALISEKVRYGIMAVDEFTTDLPEHSDLEPAAYWDKRARGLGSTRIRPCVSCGEENLLRYQGDPYHAESILIHEFAHAFHLQGLNVATPEWEAKLIKCYNNAMAKGLWKGKYAATNKEEYWAEGVQSFFDTNRPPDHDHNHVDTREELKTYDPALHDLISETFHHAPWRYTHPSTRLGQGHLKGYDPKSAPEFRWPQAVLDAYAAHQEAERNLPLSPPLSLETLAGAMSPRGGDPTQLLLRNETEKPVRLFWIDFEGKREALGWVRNGYDLKQHTFAGHLFLTTDTEGNPLTLFEALEKRSRGVIR